MLLSDPKAQQFLQSEVVPSWEMVREAPKVTIDFGHGKKLERTLKGNTVLYLCTPDGKVLDAWPGVYTADDFLRQATNSLAELRKLNIDPGKPLTNTEATALIAWHHRAAAGYASRTDMPIRTTTSKMGVESPILKLLGQPVDPPRGPYAYGLARQNAAQQTSPNPPPTADQSRMRMLFARYVARLHDASEDPMDASRATVVATGEVAPNLSPEELGRIAVQKDSSNNSFYVRPAVHLWIASLDAIPTPQTAKLDVFKTILHVPIDDPYLGLADVLPPGTPKGKG